MCIRDSLVPVYLKDDGVRVDRYRSIRTVLTIHLSLIHISLGRPTSTVDMRIWRPLISCGN